ncbi:hypothetical protein [Salinimicrobium flavum]|uniref:PKD domain-containing protein n=1 Tax=Salinimicrobium flavum TaxID=1737065 RepID=A0ABW5IVM5_9FLAO
MKKLRIIAGFLLLLAVTVGCSVEDGMDSDTSFIDSANIENIDAVFEITNDNSGTVTITPTGEGAIFFVVDFGDGTSTSGEIKAGESVQHEYEEGDYDVVITGKNLAGETAQSTEPLTVSFRAPENLEVAIDLDVDGYTVSVSATAEYAALFHVYFGETADEEPTPLMLGESVAHTYGTSGAYDIRVVALSGGEATIEYTETTDITGPTDPMSLPLTFDDHTIQYVPQGEGAIFNGASFDIVPVSEVNATKTDEDRVGALTNSGSQWEGITFTLDPPVDFSTENKTVTMKMYSEVAVPVLLKFEGGMNGERQNEVTVNHSGTGWEELSFDFNNATKSYIDGNQGVGEPFVPTGQYSKMTIFVDGPGTTAGTFYFDDINLVMEVLPNPEFPINLEESDIDYTWNGFGASDYSSIPAELVDNPDPSGINTSSTVLEIHKLSGAWDWAGASMNLAGPVDFTKGNMVTIKVWSPREGTTIRFKMEDSNSPKDGNGNPTVFVEVDATTTVAGVWEELSFDLTSDASFNSSTPYDRVIIFPDFGKAGNDELFYFDDLVLSFPKPEFPITFEASGMDYTWSGFGRLDYGGIPAELVDNPDPSGVNTSATVLEVNKLTDAWEWAGASMNLAGPVDFSSGTTVTVQVWSPRVGTPIMFKMEDSNSPKDGNGNPTVFVEVQATSTVAGAWEELTFDLTSYNDFSTDKPYDRVILFPDFGSRGKGEIFYFDNLQLTN